jgi:hypothetical protein
MSLIPHKRPIKNKYLIIRMQLIIFKHPITHSYTNNNSNNNNSAMYEARPREQLHAAI